MSRDVWINVPFKLLWCRTGGVWCLLVGLCRVTLIAHLAVSSGPERSYAWGYNGFLRVAYGKGWG